MYAHDCTREIEDVTDGRVVAKFPYRGYPNDRCERSTAVRETSNSEVILHHPSTDHGYLPLPDALLREQTFGLPTDQGPSGRDHVCVLNIQVLIMFVRVTVLSPGAEPSLGKPM
jgi:hypothetical protein